MGEAYIREYENGCWPLDCLDNSHLGLTFRPLSRATLSHILPYGFTFLPHHLFGPCDFSYLGPHFHYALVIIILHNLLLNMKDMRR